MSENQKMLAQQIKEDLQKDLEEAKKEEKSKRGFGGCSWLKTLGEDCGSYRGNEWRLTYFGSDKNKYKERDIYGAREGIYAFSEELEPNDWKEIEALIQQIKALENEKKNKETQKYQEEQAEINQKLSSNPQMFFYVGKQEWADDSPKGYDIYHGFRGWENNQEFWLGVSENQVANLSRWKSGEIFCLIEGAEKVPFEQKQPRKVVKLSDKITITPVDNSVYIEELQNNKIECELYLAKVQADEEYYDRDGAIADTKKRIKEYEEEIQEEKKWLAEHGNKIPTSPENKGNIPKSPLKELNYKTLLQYFLGKNIKSIKLENNSLIIEYKDRQEKETKEIKDIQTQQIKSFAEKLGKSELTLSDLEQINNQSNSPKSNKGLYIGLAIGGALVIGLIALLLMRKNKEK